MFNETLSGCLLLFLSGCPFAQWVCDGYSSLWGQVLWWWWLCLCSDRLWSEWDYPLHTDIGCCFHWIEWYIEWYMNLVYSSQKNIITHPVDGCQVRAHFRSCWVLLCCCLGRSVIMAFLSWSLLKLKRRLARTKIICDVFKVVETFMYKCWYECRFIK